MFGILTHLYGLDLGKRTCAYITLGVLASIPFVYAKVGVPLSQIVVIPRLACLQISAPLVWLIWVLGSLVLWPLRPIYSHFPSLKATFWFLLWAVSIALFARLGPTQPSGK